MRVAIGKKRLALILASAVSLTAVSLLAGHKSQQTVLTGKVFIAPVSVIQEYAPGGFEAADKWLAASPEVWQPVIAEKLNKRAQKSGGAFEVQAISADEFRPALEAILRAKGITGFVEQGTNQLDESAFNAAMGDIAKKFGGTLLVPRIVQKEVTVKQLWTGEASPKAKWDGVTRKVETGHHMFKHAYLRGQSVPVLSLRLEGFLPDGSPLLLAPADGGFDVVLKYSVGFLKVKEKDMDIGYLFSKKNSDHMEEATDEAFKALFEH
jgi:hypothetical protein